MGRAKDETTRAQGKLWVPSLCSLYHLVNTEGYSGIDFAKVVPQSGSVLVSGSFVAEPS